MVFALAGDSTTTSFKTSPHVYAYKVGVEETARQAGQRRDCGPVERYGKGKGDCTLLMIAALGMEALVRPPVAGFVSGYELAKSGNYIQEQVPAGETVQQWTRMITTQRFAGVAKKADANGFLQLMIDGLSKGCPGASLAYRRGSSAIAQMRVDCPLNPATRRPETFFAKAMAGSADMHVAQVAFRSVPKARDVAWAEKYLTSVSLKP